MGVLARSRNPILRLDFFKNRGFCTFPSIYCLWRVVWLWFFYWCKEQCQADLLNTLNMVMECIENFLEAFEKKVSNQKWGVGKKSQPHFETGFFKNRVFCTFPWICFLWRVVWLWFFYWRKEQCQTNLLSTLNMVMECIQNFLEAFEKQKSSQKWGFWQEVPTPFWDFLPNPPFLTWFLFFRCL